MILLGYKCTCNNGTAGVANRQGLYAEFIKKLALRNIHGLTKTHRASFQSVWCCKALVPKGFHPRLSTTTPCHDPRFQHVLFHCRETAAKVDIRYGSITYEMTWPSCKPSSWKAIVTDKPGLEQSLTRLHQRKLGIHIKHLSDANDFDKQHIREAKLYTWPKSYQTPCKIQNSPATNYWLTKCTSTFGFFHTQPHNALFHAQQSFQVQGLWHFAC